MCVSYMDTSSNFYFNGAGASGTGFSTRWDLDELNYYVQNGIFAKIFNETEHFALHPYWLSNPLQGLQEEFQGSLGKWRPKSNGYLVAYEDLKIDRSKPIAINVDHPWLHTDIKTTVYTYTPAVGQILKGVVRKIGENAAICVMFHYFSITVQPENKSQLACWTIGNEFEFQVKSFKNRRKRPIIQATFVQKLTDYKDSDSGFVDLNNTTATGGIENQQETPSQSHFELNLNLSNKLKAKKNKKIIFSDDVDDELPHEEMEVDPTPVSSKPSKSKRIKIEEPSAIEAIDINWISMIEADEVDSVPEKKKKKKHKSKD